MDAYQLAGRHGEQAVGIIIPQIVFDGKGQLHDVVNGVDVARLQSGVLQLLFIKWNVFIGALHHFNQARRLDGVQVVLRSAFNFRLIDWHGFLSFLLRRTGGWIERARRRYRIAA